MDSAIDLLALRDAVGTYRNSGMAYAPEAHPKRRVATTREPIWPKCESARTGAGAFIGM